VKVYDTLWLVIASQLLNKIISTCRNVYYKVQTSPYGTDVIYMTRPT